MNEKIYANFRYPKILHKYVKIIYGRPFFSFGTKFTLFNELFIVKIIAFWLHEVPHKFADISLLNFLDAFQISIIFYLAKLSGFL
jgi:hypothetical protein